MKNFKKFGYLLLILVFVCIIITNPLTSKAGSTFVTVSTGKAIIPFYSADPSGMTGFTVSNITDKPIDVCVTFYKTDGTILTDDNNINTGAINGTDLLNYCDQNSDSSATFTLNAHNSGIFRSAQSVKKYGYAVIEWKQDGSTQQGLVVHGATYSTDSTGGVVRFAVPVNGGMPF